MIGLFDPRLVRESAWNLAGLGAPLVAAIVAIPWLLAAAGVERFGLLSLVWSLIGYASLFDLGLGRALARSLARPLREGFGAVSGSAAILLTLLGLAGATLVWVAASPLARSLETGSVAASEVATAFRWCAAAVPAVALTAGLRGALEARRAFAKLSLARTLFGIATLAAPLATPTSLPRMVLGLVVLRWVFLAAHIAVARNAAPELLRHWHWSPTEARALASFGGWITVSAVISPLLVSLDRFLIGSFLSAAAVAAYVTPFEVVSRLLVIPSAICGVVLPAFSREQDARRIYHQALAATALLLALPCGILAVMAGPLLTWWTSGRLGVESDSVLQMLAAGVWITGVANIPAAWLHAHGRPDLTAKFHLLEILLYVPLLSAALAVDGIRGAALAWVMRAAVDAALLFRAAGHGSASLPPPWPISEEPDVRSQPA